MWWYIFFHFHHQNILDLDFFLSLKQKTHIDDHHQNLPHIELDNASLLELLLSQLQQKLSIDFHHQREII